MTLTFPRTLQSQGHRGHVNLSGKVATSQSSEVSQWKRATEEEEAGGGRGVSVFYQEEDVGFKDSLGTAGRRAGHTRLQRRLPLAPRPVSCFLACWPATYSTLPAPTYSSLLLISLGSKQLAAWATGCCWDPPSSDRSPSPIELARTGHS